MSMCAQKENTTLNAVIVKIHGQGTWPTKSLVQRKRLHISKEKKLN